MTEYNYDKALNYSDLKEVYKNCSGPGGLKLTEFLADKMKLEQGKKLLDIGTHKGYQTCFLAREYSPFVTGIDPWADEVEQLMSNAREWGVDDRIIGVKTGVPDTKFAPATFDRIYSTTTLEMIRGIKGKEGYR
ncbi:MAG: SAM-dependent methyltransferase, partial [Halanaerobiales bacterium]